MIYVCIRDVVAVILYSTATCLDVLAALATKSVYAMVKSGVSTLAILLFYVRRRTVNAANSVYIFVVVISKTQPHALSQQVTAAALLVSVLSHLSPISLVSVQTMV